MVRLGELWRRTEEGVLVGALLLMMLLPLVDMLGRPGGFHLPGSGAYLPHLTLLVTFAGALLAARAGNHLTLSTAEMLSGDRARKAAKLLSHAMAAAIVAVLAWASVGLVLADREGGKVLSIGLPVWVVECVMPIALALIAVRFVLRASATFRGRAIAAAAVPAAFALSLTQPWMGLMVWPLLALILASAIAGAPVFTAMAGIALLLFFRDGTPVSAVSAEIYRLIASPALPAIPLLTACGYVLAESRASERMVRLFQALLGWMPGGIAILVAVVCAAFTSFTGGSGVTIVALGGLVYPILRKGGYPEGFSLGMVTASGSLGLLFFPSLPIVLYSVVAKVPADDLFLACLIPGILLLLLVAAYGVVVGVRVRAPRTSFSAKEAVAAAWATKWELSLPVLVAVLFLGGIASIVEASAAACAYAIFIECVVTRDLHPVRELPRVLVKGGALMGAVLILLSAAMGATSWLVDAQIPDRVLEIVQANIASPFVFLLVLNVLLLVLGSVLEIYAAIIVLTPLVVPLGAAYGIDPVHLGVIFLANLELGFLLPPVGLNLFLSSSRFEKPLPELYRHVIPFLVVLGAGVLAITYIEGLSLGILRLSSA